MPSARLSTTMLREASPTIQCRYETPRPSPALSPTITVSARAASTSSTLANVAAIHSGNSKAQTFFLPAAGASA